MHHFMDMVHARQGEPMNGSCHDVQHLLQCSPRECEHSIQALYHQLIRSSSSAVVIDDDYMELSSHVYYDQQQYRVAVQCAFIPESANDVKIVFDMMVDYTFTMNIAGIVGDLSVNDRHITIA